MPSSLFLPFLRKHWQILCWTFFPSVVFNQSCVWTGSLKFSWDLWKVATVLVGKLLEPWTQLIIYYVILVTYIISLGLHCLVCKSSCFVGFFGKTENSNACESHKLGQCMEDSKCSVRVGYCFSSSVMFWMETKMTFILLRKETESKFTKIASLRVMISNYALVDRIQVLEIILAKNISKYHHGTMIKKYFFFFLC